MKSFAVVVLALSAALAAQAPSTASLFKESRAAAAQLPSPVAEHELQWIAGDEQLALPQQALRDYRALYAQVHAWPAGSDTPAAKARTQLRFAIEGNAIDAFAAQGELWQALAWLAAYDHRYARQGMPAHYYSQVIRKMMAQGDFGQVQPTIQQCITEGDGYPYLGAAAALRSQMSLEQRMEIAGAAVAAAAAAPALGTAGPLLERVHAVFPDRDGQVEDAILALLKTVHADAAQHPGHAQYDHRDGAQLLALLRRIDPARAQTVRAAYPGTAGVAANWAVVVPQSAWGQLGGGPNVALMGRAFRSQAMARKNPDGALAGAAKIQGNNARFAALAAIAQALAKSHPRRAQQAADAADALLDKHVAQADTMFAASLAQAYATLGDSAKAAAVAGTALDAADVLARQAGSAYDLTTPDGAAQAEQSMTFRPMGITAAYLKVATFLPQLALRHARACTCALLQPLLLAKIAAALAPPAPRRSAEK